MSDTGDKPDKPDFFEQAMAAADALGKQKKATKVRLKRKLAVMSRTAKAATAKRKYQRVAWLNAARVVDLPSYDRLRATGVGAKKISRALSTTQATAQKLMAGAHWQQNPEKVAEFNRFHGANLSPEGVPTADDLAKHGAKYAQALKTDTEGEKDLRRMVEDAGVSPGIVAETVRRLQLLSGAMQAGDLPHRADTKYFQDAFDEKLKLALACMDPVTIASASPGDLTRLVSMLVEKRALLRGEPTAIVRNEQRGGLDKVAALLMAELTRRGVALDLPKGAGGYQEVLHETGGA